MTDECKIDPDPTLLHRGAMTIFEGLRLRNGAVHLMRYACLQMGGAFYVKLGPEEAEALRVWMHDAAREPRAAQAPPPVSPISLQDTAPMLTYKELTAEAARQGYRLVAQGTTARRPVRDLPATPEPWEETPAPAGQPTHSSGLTILQAAQQHWCATHGNRAWSEDTARRCMAALTGKSWVFALPYEKHKVALADDPELRQWFPSVGG